MLPYTLPHLLRCTLSHIHCSPIRSLISLFPETLPRPLFPNSPPAPCSQILPQPPVPQYSHHNPQFWLSTHQYSYDLSSFLEVSLNLATTHCGRSRAHNALNSSAPVTCHIALLGNVKRTQAKPTQCTRSCSFSINFSIKLPSTTASLKVSSLHGFGIYI
jgi:hypothetical protein